MTTLDEARMELEDIARWAPLLPASWSSTPIRSARGADGTTHAHLSYAPLPGGMEHAIDTWEQNGPLGIHTRIGIAQALGPWQDELRGMGAPAMPGTGPVDYLTATAQWAIDHMPNAQWQMMCADVHAVWGRVQHLVCPPVEKAGTCPECGARLEWIMGSQGKINMPICPAGHTIRNLTAQQLQRIRNADEQDAPAYATIAEIHTLWPTIKAGTLSAWVKRGHVRKEGDRYCINDIALRHAEDDSQEVA